MTYKRETIVNIGALESAINFAYTGLEIIAADELKDFSEIVVAGIKKN